MIDTYSYCVKYCGKKAEEGESMVKAVIFDMDGVLIDTEKYLVKYWCQAAQELGIPMKREHALMIRSFSGKFAEPWLKSLYGEDFDYAAVRERRKKMMAEHLAKNGVEIKEGVRETLTYLREKGYKLAVATATEKDRAVEYLNEIGITEMFDQIVCANMVQNGKPMPDIYLYVCEQIGEEPENCVAVEDSPNGVKSAHDAGCRVIMIPDLTLPDAETDSYLWKQVGKMNDLQQIL